MTLSSAAEIGSQLRIRGRVVERSLPPPARWQVRIGRRRVQRTASGWLALDVDGARVRVDVSSTAELIGDTQEEDGRLGVLAARAGLPDDLGPPDVQARLSLIDPSVGAEIAVEGEVTDVAGDLTTVRAHLISCGASPAALMDAVLARRRLLDRGRPPRRTAPPPLAPAADAPAGDAIAAPRPALPIVLLAAVAVLVLAIVAALLAR